MIRECMNQEGFQFYGYGQVLPEENLSEAMPAADSLCAAYALNGDLRGAVLLFVPAADAQGNESLYLEMGNILASRLADRLANAGQMDLLISPPRILHNETWKKLSIEKGERAGYRYYTEGREVLLQLIVVAEWQTAPSEGAANA